MRSDPWKFESIWRSENWLNQTTLEEFLASTGYLYISDKVLGGTGTYFMLTSNKVQLWANGELVAEWDTIDIPVPPVGGSGELMGLLMMTFP